MYMKKILIAILALMPLSMWAQDNSWERPEEEKQEVKVAKPKVDVKYLRGAVPEVNGKVVFSKSIDVPGKSAAQIYGIVKDYMEKMQKESNQIDSRFIVDDSVANTEIAGRYMEWLIFKKSALVLDQTRFIYVLNAKCQDGKVDLTMSHISYLYEEERDPQKLIAEEWITDKEAVNKKNTRLYPITGKFRRKTIDRKDFLFNKIESLLK